jgi:predicted nucleic acid-binding protein
MILLDAGPMVALLHADDRHHQECKETLQSLTEPLGSVWPVVTEAMYLLGFSWRAQDALWEFLERGGVTLLSPTPRPAAGRPGEPACSRAYGSISRRIAEVM